MLLQKLRSPSFLWLSNIPLYKCTTAFLSFYLLMGTWALPVMSAVNNVAMNIGIHIFFWISASGFFGYIPRNGIAIFEVTPCCFPQWLYQSAFPPALGKGSFFLYILTNFLIFLVFQKIKNLNKIIYNVDKHWIMSGCTGFFFFTFFTF